MKFAGTLNTKDYGRSWKEIREETERMAAEEIAAKFESLAKSKPRFSTSKQNRSMDKQHHPTNKS